MCTSKVLPSPFCTITCAESRENQLALGDCRLKDDNIGSVAACTRSILFLGTPFQGTFMAEPIPDRDDKIYMYMDPVDTSRFGRKGDEGCKKIATTLQKIIGDIIRDDPKKPEVSSLISGEYRVAKFIPGGKVREQR